MAKIQIPKMVLPGFEIIAKLKPVEVKNIGKLLKNMPVGIGPKAFKQYISNEVPFEGIEAIATTIYSFGKLLVSIDDLSVEEIAIDLFSSYIEATPVKLNIQLQKSLKSNLQILFNDFDRLKLTFKARDLLLENNIIYREARILSDIRLIFNEKIEDHTRNAVIVHQLKIEYQTEKGTDAFFASMDISDLKKLKDQIDRAFEKENFIRKDYKEGINFIEFTE